jgi:hypothetical protein
MWHFRGTPPYLSAQAKRIGMNETLTSRARHNSEIHRVSILLGQLCERWHRCRKEDDRPVVGPGERDAIAAVLGQCEAESLKLHALAASAASMIDEAWEAFGLTPPQRTHAVLADSDAPLVPTPQGNGAVPALKKVAH